MSQEQKDRISATIAILSLVVSITWFVSDPKFETLMLVLSTIATALTLYTSKKRIVEIEKRYITKPKRLFEVSVALWGPIGSGKSWLIYALSRILSLKYIREIEGLHYQIEQTYSKGYFANTPSATQDTYSTIINFERSRTTDQFGQSISSFKHKIQILDHPGGYTTGEVVEVANTQENREKTLHIAMSLADADIVIVTLDPRFSGIHFWQETEEIKEHQKDKYVEYVANLFSVLEKIRPDKQRYYAVCLTKSDLIPEAQYNNPDGLIELIFGKNMTQAIKSINSEHIKSFIVSSFGFLPNSTTPNYDGSNDRFLDTENWLPYGVEFPFFWAFERLEKQALLEKFNKSFWGRLTAKSKIKKYIPYPKPNYDL